MTSPVDTTVKYARSSMPGAPVLTRVAGSLIGVLDALLVDGWGMATASSVVVAGGIATATFPADHAAAPHSVVLVAGVTGSLMALNGEQKITAVEPNKIKWATAAADGTATGTITVKMAPAGFAKPFSGTNLAVYKSVATAAHGQFLRVADTAADAARVVGFENMSDVSTGTGQFPTEAQVSGGYIWGKSEGGSVGAASPWVFASDGRMFYLFVQSYLSGGVAAKGTLLMAFGDLVPECPAGDPFATVIGGSPSSYWIGMGSVFLLNYNSLDYAVAVPRNFSGSGTAARGCTSVESGFAALSASLPNPISGTMPISRCVYKDTAGGFVRAIWPGMGFCVARDADSAVDNQQLLTMPNGRTYIASLTGDQAYSSNSLTAALIDVIGPWR